MECERKFSTTITLPNTFTEDCQKQYLLIKPTPFTKIQPFQLNHFEATILSTLAHLKRSAGQSTTEFLLVVSVLLLLFFGILQTAYMAYTYFAVQRAALAIARMASLSAAFEEKEKTTLQTQLVISLLPLVRLNSSTLPSIAASQYDLAYSSDHQKIIVKVSYPMPVLVPLAGQIFGTSFLPPSQTDLDRALHSIGSLAPFSKISIPHSSNGSPRVIWIICQAATFNEAYNRSNKAFER